LDLDFVRSTRLAGAPGLFCGERCLRSRPICIAACRGDCWTLAAPLPDSTGHLFAFGAFGARAGRCFGGHLLDCGAGVLDYLPPTVPKGLFQGWCSLVAVCLVQRRPCYLLLARMCVIVVCLLRPRHSSLAHCLGPFSRSPSRSGVTSVCAG
jgi:hypothetical protein